MDNSNIDKNNAFVFVARPDTSRGTKHYFGITSDGKAFSWGKNNFGQLGLSSSTSSSSSSSNSNVVKAPLPIDHDGTKFVKAYVGGLSDSGHSALLDTNGYLWMAGCDRWQQLGLGSSAGGSSGYTWNQGRVWRNQFVRNDFLAAKLGDATTNSTIRDVALGGDHTVVLSSNQSDVYVFGKGAEGQLGVDGKPFVSAPTRSKVLSSSSADQRKIAAVCASQYCSWTLDETGRTIQKTGKCRSALNKTALQHCIRRAESDGLLVSRSGKQKDETSE